MAGHVLERSTVKDVADVMMGYPSRTFTKVGARWRVSSAVERRELRWARYGAVSGRRALDALAAGATRCLLYTSPSPRDGLLSRMPSSA